MLELLIDITVILCLGVMIGVCAAAALVGLWLALRLSYILCTGNVDRIDRRSMAVVDFPLCDFKWSDSNGFCNVPATLHVDGKNYCGNHAPLTVRYSNRIISLRKD